MPYTYTERYKLMGMSASQARLLSITSRLTNNELQAQLITNSKLRLATESEYVTNKYMNALDSTQLMYTTYDDSGQMTKVSLTPAVIYNYEPCKNQYLMINSADKIIVSKEDADNFENTKSLQEFLDCYGLTYDGSIDVNETLQARYEAQLAKYKQAMQEYEDSEEYKQYIADKNQYDMVDKPKYDADIAAYSALMEQYEKDYADYLESLNNNDDSMYQNFTSVVGNSKTATGDGAQYCYYNAINGDPGCYLHFLNHILDYGGEDVSSNTYTTSLGQQFTTGGGGGGMHSSLSAEQKQALKDLSETLNDPNYKTDGADTFVPDYNTTDGQDSLSGNIIQDAIDAGRTPTDVDILMSDYGYDPATNTCTGRKTLKQKTQDLYYLIQKGLVTDVSKMRELLINFTEGDLKQVAAKDEPVPPVKPVEPKKPIEPTPPKKPTKPDEVAGYILVKDKDKSQWYTNLWYKMNNSLSANVVNKVDFQADDNWDSVPEEIKAEFPYTVKNSDKDVTQCMYTILDNNLLNSSEWLQFALEHGIIRMEQATFYNPADDSLKVPEMIGEGYVWKSIIYSNATDIREQDDEKKIAIAEAQYKKSINEIQAKDKKYDQDLKNLDTEHNALQTEYNSVKELIGKNVDRSFKAFS